MSAGTVASAAPIGHSPLLTPQPYRVVDEVIEGAETRTLHVVPLEGSLPSFRPAQFSMLGAVGVGEAAISISSSADNTDYHAYTVRRAGAISGSLVDTPVGGIITVRGPFGSPWPLDRLETRQLLIIGGGLGIAPLRAAIHEAVVRSDLDRVAIVYGVKTPDGLIYRNDLASWQREGAEVQITVDVADRAWTGHVGVAPERLGGDGGIELDWADASAFVCGPDTMMRVTARVLHLLGVFEDRIWLTLERNMQCGNALCGHCQLGPIIVCRDGPVVRYSDVAPFYRVKEL